MEGADGGPEEVQPRFTTMTNQGCVFRHPRDADEPARQAAPRRTAEQGMSDGPERCLAVLQTLWLRIRNDLTPRSVMHRPPTTAAHPTGPARGGCGRGEWGARGRGWTLATRCRRARMLMNPGNHGPMGIRDPARAPAR